MTTDTTLRWHRQRVALKWTFATKARTKRDGHRRDCVAAVDRFGITRARMTQISNLATLSPEIQERLLASERDRTNGMCEGSQRSAIGNDRWNRFEDLRACATSQSSTDLRDGLVEHWSERIRTLAAMSGGGRTGCHAPRGEPPHSLQAVLQE